MENLNSDDFSYYNLDVWFTCCVVTILLRCFNIAVGEKETFYSVNKTVYYYSTFKDIYKLFTLYWDGLLYQPTYSALFGRTSVSHPAIASSVALYDSI